MTQLFQRTQFQIPVAVSGSSHPPVTPAPGECNKPLDSEGTCTGVHTPYLKLKMIKYVFKNAPFSQLLCF